MRFRLFYFLIICLSWIGCAQNTNSLDCKNLEKVEITDSCFINILKDYIKAFPFEGKGIYLATIKKSGDTVEYYVTTVFTKEELSTVLKNPPYYFYNLINNRIVIIDTKFEKYIKPGYVKFDCDTLLTKYYNTQEKSGWREVYCIEFKSFSDTITRKAIQFDPF